MPFKRVNTSNLMKFECCFLISQYHENCNAMSSLTVLRHAPWNTFICKAVQCFHQFAMVFIYCLRSFFRDAACSKHLDEIVVEHSIFECNIQKSVPRSLQLRKYYVIKNRNMQLRFEIAVADIRDQLMTNDKLPELSYRYSQNPHLSQFLSQWKKCAMR